MQQLDPQVDVTVRLRPSPLGAMELVGNEVILVDVEDIDGHGQRIVRTWSGHSVESMP